jgi:hypothetical protein
MSDIDFLPLEYRQQHARQQVQPWRVFVVAAFLALLAAGVFAQQQRRRTAQSALAAILPSHEEASREKSRLAEIRLTLLAVEAEAELRTYLRHPWPRTRILAAVLTPLPKAITLQQVQMARETPQGVALVDARPHGDKKAEEEKLAKLPPAHRDLKRLRDEYDRQQTLVRLVGTTEDNVALYRYLRELGECNLFAKVELQNIGRLEGAQGATLRFGATLIVRPGYGQPGGPAAPEPAADMAKVKAEAPLEEELP